MYVGYVQEARKFGVYTPAKESSIIPEFSIRGMCPS